RPPGLSPGVQFGGRRLLQGQAAAPVMRRDWGTLVTFALVSAAGGPLLMTSVRPPPPAARWRERAPGCCYSKGEVVMRNRMSRKLVIAGIAALALFWIGTTAAQ